MSIFDLFRRGPGIQKGLEEFHSTPGAVLLDVRTKEEYVQGHVPESINMPLERLTSIQVGKDRPLFVYCLSGARSAQACRWLNRKGYTATNIGGLTGYRGPMK